MATAMPRLSGEPEAPVDSIQPAAPPRKTAGKAPRKVPRRRAADPRRISLISTVPVEASLADLSSHGCCLDIVSGEVRPGAIVGLPLGGKNVLRAIVRWVRDDQAGLEFFQAIPSDLVEEWA